MASNPMVNVVMAQAMREQADRFARYGDTLRAVGELLDRHDIAGATATLRGATAARQAEREASVNK